MKKTKTIQGPPISVAFRDVCVTCKKATKPYEYQGKKYCRNCYYKAIGFIKSKPRLIALVWNVGDRMPDKEFYLTDAPKTAIEVAIKLVKEIKDYNVDDFTEFIYEDYYIEKVKAEEYDF